ncbi:MAG: carboxymuconolactone decarboxylase family protein [Candidatus Micrarchaeia archaeon]|jgi:4-carboxymuconolactone decarboxylase
MARTKQTGTLIAQGRRVFEQVYGGGNAAEKRLETIRSYHPLAEELLLEGAYAKILSRQKELPLKTRELCTVAMLAALGRERQLAGHLQGALNAGASEQEVKEVLLQTMPYAGWPACLSAFQVFSELLEANPKKGTKGKKK